MDTVCNTIASTFGFPQWNLIALVINISKKYFPEFDMKFKMQSEQKIFEFALQNKSNDDTAAPQNQIQDDVAMPTGAQEAAGKLSSVFNFIGDHNNHNQEISRNAECPGASVKILDPGTGNTTVNSNGSRKGGKFVFNNDLKFT